MREFLLSRIREAGEICRAEQVKLQDADVEYKHGREIVTRVDRQVEMFLREQINDRYPDHGIIGEEGGTTLGGASHCWIIDPIDGTTSYRFGQSYYSISVALRVDNELSAASVYAPALGQLFYAQRGDGAFLDGVRISVSGRRLNEAILSTGFACLRSGWQDNNLKYFNRLVPRILDIRRCGSAALDMAYVACGKYDGFWELNLNLYDIAAGALLVAEAGGRVCDFSGGGSYPEQGIVAANPGLTAEILPYLR
ncbi:MAG: inositol monophosphatase [Desulfofustis sp.]|jgi:myo-inositol-1(or 4)-monophosphatase|nr:inositol monophosphatase [Desulfofustis sp.]